MGDHECPWPEFTIMYLGKSEKEPGERNSGVLQCCGHAVRALHILSSASYVVGPHAKRIKSSIDSAVFDPEDFGHLNLLRVYGLLPKSLERTVKNFW